MKRFIIVALLLVSSLVSIHAKDEIVKTGWNIGPLPAIAYDADKGFQLGAVLQLFNYGDGHNYPNYDSKWYFEASFFTKGSQLYQVRYDDKVLIPNVRWSSALRVNLDKAFDFYGFNGYQSYYDYNRIEMGKSGESYIFTPFYKQAHKEVQFKSDFIGDITDNFKWEAGIFANYHKLGTIDYDSINKNKSESEVFPLTMPTLLDVYHRCGVISDEEFAGGFSSGVRLGFVYDSRDKEGAPSRGVWAETHLTAAPKFLSHIQYFRYSATWRHYVPIVDEDVLTFAYRLNYEGTIGNNAPYYALPYMTVMGEKSDLDGMGGFFTVRGIMRARVVGLDMAAYNAELRWRFVKFRIGKQNIALGLNAFSDGAMVTRGRDLSGLNGLSGFPVVIKTDNKEVPHISFGGGFRFIMNENFIVAAEYGMPLTHLMKNSPNYNQDGPGAFYLNIGYLF